MASVIRSYAQAHPAAARYNIYTIIHKGIRGFMTDALHRWGRMDVADICERAEAVAALRALLTMCTDHLRHENEFLHPAIERARAGDAARTAHDHTEHEKAIAGLAADLTHFEAAPEADHSMLARQIYLELSAFVAENFDHMIIEETENHAALIGAYSDQEILAIERRIVESQSPAEAFTGLRWMLGHINADERAFLFGGIMRDAPREVFEAVMGLAREVLSQRDFYKLERALS